MNKILLLIPLITYILIETNMFNIKSIFNQIQKYFRITFIILLCLVVYKYQLSDKTDIPSIGKVIMNSKQYKNYKSIANFLYSFIKIFNNKNKNINSIIYDNTINNNHRRVSELLKKQIAANQRWKCNSCSNLLDASYEIDHIIPLYKNGNNASNNLQALCRNCHGKKTINDKLNVNNSY